MSYTDLHHVFQVGHPMFDRFAHWVDRPNEVHLLPLRTVHGQDLLTLVKLHFTHILEHFVQVWLHGGRLLSLTQNCNQVIIGKEVKSREAFSLLLQVVIQSLLNHVQTFSGLTHFIQETFSLASFEDILQLLSYLQRLLPNGVNYLELFGLSRELFGDIGGLKDRLEVHPL